MILTANNMKFSAEKVSRVESAFSMAGIENSGQSGKYSTDIQISVVDKNGEPYSEYSVNIVGKKDLPLWFTEEYNANYDGDKEFGVDARARYAITEKTAVTGMFNYSSIAKELKASKSGD